MRPFPQSTVHFQLVSAVSVIPVVSEHGLTVEIIYWLTGTGSDDVAVLALEYRWPIYIPTLLLMTPHSKSFHYSVIEGKKLACQWIMRLCYQVLIRTLGVWIIQSLERRLGGSVGE